MVNKTFNYLLLTCGLMLLIHVAMLVVTERNNGTRAYATPEARRALLTAMTFLSRGGDDPANSALVLSLENGRAPSTLAVWDSPYFFDFAAQGRAVQTAWPGPGAGFLVYDRNGDGRINNGREIFGNRTGPGDPHTQTGFAALALLDSNHDGLIDHRDQDWFKLKVWLKVRGGPLATGGDLAALDQLRIASLSLKPEMVNQRLANCDYHLSTGAVNLAGGRQGRLDEIFFQQFADRRLTVGQPDSPPPPAADFPSLKGAGLVDDFQVAAAYSPSLRQVFERYRRAVSRADQLALIDELVAAWTLAGDSFPPLAERAARYHPQPNCLTEQSPAALDHLQILETWAAHGAYRLPHELWPGQAADQRAVAREGDGPGLNLTCPAGDWQGFEQAYNRLTRRIYLNLLRSTRLREAFDLWANNPGDVAPVAAYFDRKLAGGPEAMFDLLDFRSALALEGWRDIPALDAFLEDRVEQAISSSSLTEEQQSLYDSLKELATASKKRRP
jgi:hypothetical protein